MYLIVAVVNSLYSDSDIAKLFKKIKVFFAISKVDCTVHDCAKEEGSSILL